MLLNPYYCERCEINKRGERIEELERELASNAEILALLKEACDELRYDRNIAGPDEVASDLIARIDAALNAAGQDVSGESRHPMSAPAIDRDLRDEAFNYAKNLAESLHRKHWSHVTNWKPLDTTVGLLTQIDNIVCGLSSRLRSDTFLNTHTERKRPREGKT